MPDQLLGPALADEVHRRLGQDVPGTGIQTYVLGEVSMITQMENILKQDLTKTPLLVNQVPFLKSRYRDTDNIGGPYPAYTLPHTANHMIAPTIRVDGVLMGTDKWGHMMQQGYWLYATERDLEWTRPTLNLFSKWLEGDATVAIPKNLDAHFKKIVAEKFGMEKPRFGIFGSYSTGIISNADHDANFMGMDLYKFIHDHPHDAADGNLLFQLHLSTMKMKQLNEVNNPSTILKGVKLSP